MSSDCILKFLLPSLVRNCIPAVLYSTDLLPTAACPASPHAEAQPQQRRLHIVRLDVASARKMQGNASENDPESWQRSLFRKSIVYVARAFHEPLDEMTDESREEHFQHLVNGDDLFVAVLEQPRPETDDGDVTVVDEDLASCSADRSLVAVGHALFQPIALDDRTLLPGGGVAVHCCGMCVDPAVQGAGIGGRLLTAAMRARAVSGAAQPLYFTGRTQNDAIQKVFYHCATTMLKENNDPSSPLAAQVAAEVFPTVVNSTRREELAAVGLLVARDRGYEAGYDADRGVYPRCYPPFLWGVFGGDPSFPTKTAHPPQHAGLHAHMRAQEDGDAALVVVRVR